MASAQTLRGREDPDYANIRIEYRETFGREPSPTARVSALRQEIRNYLNEGGVPVTNTGAVKGEDQAETGVGGGGPDEETQLTILTGKEMEWFYDRGAGKWFVQYGLPDSNRTIVFEADPDQMDALFGKGLRPTNYRLISTKTLLARDLVTFGGNIAEVEGNGSFEDGVTKVKAIALDNGKLPSWMDDDGEAMDIIYLAQTEGKSNEWIMEQFSKLPTFKARFPNIEKLMKSGNLTLTEAVSGFLEYEAGIKQAVAAMGQDADAINPTVVGGLMERGYNLKSATEALTVYRRMEDFAPALESFNAILAANDLDPITSTQGWYDFLQGNAPAEFYDIYEASSIQEAATQAGLGDLFSADDAIDAALQGNFTLENATAGMQKAAQLLLRMRSEVATAEYGLDAEDLIDLSLGVKPSSGKSEAEIFEAVNRATLNARAQLQKRARPYSSFTADGVPQSVSLSKLRQ